MTTEPHERVQELDVLRGLSLFGILIVNILDYAPAPGSGADRLTSAVIEIFADGSFYPLFSLLFGAGFVLFLERAFARGGNGTVLYLRRIAGLLGFAVLQIIFLEDRNILVRYAFLALPLLLFWRASARTCLVAALVCLGLSMAHLPIHRALTQRQMRDPATASAARDEQAAMMTRIQAQNAERERVAATGSYLEIARFRAVWAVPTQLKWSTDLRRNPTLVHILGIFLLGAAMLRSRILLDPSRHRGLFRILLLVGASVGVVGNLLISAGTDGEPVAMLTGHPATIRAVSLLANTLLTLAYVSAVVLVLSADRPAWYRRLAPLGLAGRMALTNYLGQSLVMSLLFLPYGLRLEFGLAFWAYPLIGAATFLLQLILSAWWLSRYRYGPAEWLWRTITYGRAQPMRLRGDTAEALAAN